MNQVACKRWYQEPWVWFNLLLLAAAVSAASFMAFIAMKNSPAEIGSRWYKEGALAKQIRHEEVMVASVNLSGNMAIDSGGKLTLTLQHDLSSTDKKVLNEINVASLQLYIEHPTMPSQDEVIKLMRIKENIYSGQLTGALSGKRRLLISPNNDRWFLTASAYFPISSSITFKPEMG